MFLQLNAKKDSWIVGWYERKGFTIIYEDDDEYTMWKQLVIKPQSHWNPSNEQMEALDWALSLAKNCGNECAFELRTLREQLKKLKG